jgi:hypothetical protein
VQYYTRNVKAKITQRNMQETPNFTGYPALRDRN